MNGRISTTNARLVRRFGWRGVAACLLAAAASHAPAAVTTVYKCFDGKLGVVYTDQPCRGEQLSIEGGTADPVAVAELQREREALSRSVAQRIMDNRRAAIERDIAPQYVFAGPPAGYGSEVYYPAYYPAGFGYYPNVADGRPPRDHLRPDLRRGGRAGTVPAPRGNLIRR
jgi:hypothetical protein